jgi:hypothetical protein
MLHAHARVKIYAEEHSVDECDSRAKRMTDDRDTRRARALKRALDCAEHRGSRGGLGVLESVVHFDVGRHARKKAWVERLQEEVGVLNKRHAESRVSDPGVWEEKQTNILSGSVPWWLTTTVFKSGSNPTKTECNVRAKISHV